MNRTLSRPGPCVPFLLALAAASASAPTAAQELLTLMAENEATARPAGKEVDAIRGDVVLRNDHIVAVLAYPIEGRNANMTTPAVGGGLIDLTGRSRQNDQLTAFYPGGRGFVFGGGWQQGRGADGCWVSVVSLPDKAGIVQTVRYSLARDNAFLVVQSTFSNGTAAPATLDLIDEVRADRTFVGHQDRDLQMHQVADEWFRQAYAFVPDHHDVAPAPKGNRPFVLRYAPRFAQGDTPYRVVLPPGGRHVLVRRVFPAATPLQLRGAVAELRSRPTRRVALRVADGGGPIDRALVTLLSGVAGNAVWAAGRTDARDPLAFSLPPGAFRVRVEALGRPPVTLTLPEDGDATRDVAMQLPGIAVGTVTGALGRPIPCKVAFRGAGETKTPHFGPDSGEIAVHNLVYSHDGRIRQEVAPGTYDLVISYGPEYDMETRRIEVARGAVANFAAQLRRTVDTTGWISADFHSHSSPSGDNTSSQLGRVLNLLCEHVEFAPCTEHNRISTYAPHLEQLGVAHLLATCTGMELTGGPGDVNHQNAFPLVRKPGIQDAGAPRTDKDPVAQIERLAMWDDGAEKLVQGNHPRIERILGDKDLDGRPDEGYERMFSFMDVIEIHPPHLIFTPPEPGSKFNNRVFRWLQVLNLGYRIPGVVNTDAHYNFHGSGWLRNYVKSPTDDPAKVDTLDVVRACEQGNIVMSNGPFMTVTWRGADGTSTAIPGNELQAPGGKGTLHVKVQCANWLDVNRVQVLYNGRPAAAANFTRKTHPAMFGKGVVKFDQEIATAFDADTHVVVAAIGEGLTLGPVFVGPHGRDRPVAVSNPIFLDVDGGGFTPNGDTLGVPLPRRGVR